MFVDYGKCFLHYARVLYIMITIKPLMQSTTKELTLKLRRNKNEETKFIKTCW